MSGGGEHAFTLLISGPVEERLDALYDAGCDDALFGSVDGVWTAGFDREADSHEEAVASAVRDVTSCGITVESVARESG